MNPLYPLPVFAAESTFLPVLRAGSRQQSTLTVPGMHWAARLVRWIDIFKIPSLSAYTPKSYLAIPNLFDGGVNQDLGNYGKRSYRPSSLPYRPSGKRSEPAKCIQRDVVALKELVQIVYDEFTCARWPAGA